MAPLKWNEAIFLFEIESNTLGLKPALEQPNRKKKRKELGEVVRSG